MKRTICTLAAALAVTTLAPAASAEFLLGPRATLSLPLPGGGLEVGGALDMRVTNPDRMIQFGVSLQSRLDGDSGVFAAEFGVSWFLGGATQWVPYAGGGLQVRAMFFDSTRVMSVAPQAQLGIISARAGRRRFFTELRAVQNIAFSAQHSLTGQSAAMPHDAFRFEPSVHAGFLF
ncbi:MAG: hypothetical protein U0325_25980 [Polyangiales bacterium]